MGDRKTGQTPCSNQIGSRTAPQWPECIPRQRGRRSTANVPIPDPRTPRELRTRRPVRHRQSMQERSRPVWPLAKARMAAAIEAEIPRPLQSPEPREPIWESQSGPSAESPAPMAQPADPGRAFQGYAWVMRLWARRPMVAPPLAWPPRDWQPTPVRAGLATVWAQRP